MKALLYPFRLEPGGRIAVTTSYDAIVRGQVIDGLMTNLGERVMRPNYGCDVQAALFDPSDELVRRDAASMIADRLQQYCPRCIVRSAKVEMAEMEPWFVVVTIVYRPSPYSTDQVIDVPVSSEFISRSRALSRGEEVVTA
jgi:phage baseplate assembly protein W